MRSKPCDYNSKQPCPISETRTSPAKPRAEPFSLDTISHWVIAPPVVGLGDRGSWRGGAATPERADPLLHEFMPDQTTTVAALKDAVERFAAERAWEPFHSPKNLSMALAAEVGELLELFLWVDSEAS